jgi:coenzyme F420-reducing hydrogenase beta subunit
MANDDIFETVVRGGYCIGCGACAAVSERVSIRLTPLGTYEAGIDGDLTAGDPAAAACAAVCPFSAVAEDETAIAARLFAATSGGAADGAPEWHDEIGYHRGTYVGHVAEGGFRENGSSGGMATWIVLELMARGEIDGVIHVHPCDEPAGNGTLLFKMTISRTPDDVRRGARSRYYPVTMASALETLRESPGARYAIVGVPCFVKAVRLLARQDPFFARAIRFHIGLVCGHFKSAAYAEYLGWLAGVVPEDLRAVEFRRKTSGLPANHYVFAATARSTGVVSEIVATQFPAGEWGLGFFKYKACDYCDDVFAETADVTIGDAWLPEYVDEVRGTNIVVVRHPALVPIIESAIAASRLALQPLAASRVAESQRAGLRHRREGLACRLHDAARRGEWVPPRRVPAAPPGREPTRAGVYRLRERLSQESHAAFAAARRLGNVAVFADRMAPLVAAYRARVRPTLLVRACLLARRLFIAAWKRRTHGGAGHST